MNPQISLIDCDSNFMENLARQLSPEGWQLKPVKAEQCLSHFSRNAPQFIVIQMQTRRLSLLRQLREAKPAPIMALIDHPDEELKIRALEIGADACMVLPVNFRELCTRIHTLQRRWKRPRHYITATRVHQILSEGPLVLNRSNWVVTYEGLPLGLTNMEFKILNLLMVAGSTVKTRQELVETLFERGYRSEDRSLDIQISNLRKKINAVDKGRVSIKTIRGVGFRLEIN